MREPEARRPGLQPAKRWAGIILVNRKGELLLNLRDDKAEIDFPNQWDLIGGVVEPGETADEGMAREMLEETGETLGAFVPFRTLDVPLPSGRFAEFHVYYARLDRPAAALLLGEGQEHRFFRPEALAALEIVPWTGDVLREFVASADYEAMR